MDTERFPAIPLAFETLEKGGTSGAVLNAADEVMTGLFLAGKVSFPAITQTVATVVRDHAATPIHTLKDVLAADRSARDATRSLASNP